MFICIYVFDKVLNCFWNLYSSLCSFCGGIEKCLFVDRCVTFGASLFQVFRQWRVAQNRAEGYRYVQGVPFVNERYTKASPYKFFFSTPRSPGMRAPYGML